MKKFIAFAVLLYIIYFIVNTLYDSGVFKTIENHSLFQNIKSYETIYGPEDLDIDHKKNSLFISSSDRRKLSLGLPANDGIYLLDLTKDSIPYKLATSFSEEFHPHGISYLHHDDKDYLFVINHNKQGHSIELFHYMNDTLFHIRSFKNELMISPNDLIATDIDNFYVTIDHGTKEGLWRTLEDYLRLPYSYVLYFDGKEYSKVYEGLNYANGVNISNDGNTLYVSETTSGKLSALNRNKNTGQLELLFSKELKTGLDNISIDNNGDLWIAAHPKLFDFLAHSKDSTKHSPSQVLKVNVSKNDFTISEIYLDNGVKFSGSSTGLSVNNEVFIGQVYDDKILRGKLLP